MSIFSRLAEQKIEEAIRNGEFDNLPLAGQKTPDRRSFAHPGRFEDVLPHHEKRGLRS